jgi:hypothetical protein
MTKTDFINRVLLIMNEAGMTDVQGNSFLGADAANIDRYIEGSYENAWRILAVTAPKAWLNNKEFKIYPLVANLAKGTGYIILPKDFYLLTALKMVGWQKAISEAAVEDEKVSSIQSNPYTQGSVNRPVGTTTNEVLEDNSIKVELCLSELPSNINESEELFLGARIYFYGDKSIHIISDVSVGGEITYTIGDIIPVGALLYKTIEGSYRVTNETDVTELAEYPGVGIAQVLNYYTLSKGLSIHEIEKAIYVPNVIPLNDVLPDSVLAVNQRIIEPLAYITAGCVCTIFQKDQLASNLTEKGLLMIPGYKSVKGTNVTIKQ